MPNASVGVGMQLGNFANDPATGNFLLLGSRQLWELNRNGAGTWTQKTLLRLVSVAQLR